MDIGSSTGGFTDCALQHGVEFVYAIDVGHNQLDWSMRNHPRVCVMERTNFRHMTSQDLVGPIPTFATIDVSFISLVLLLPPLKQMIAPHSNIVALIKPQFEAGKAQVGKSGVIREASIHREVLQKVTQIAEQLGFQLQGLTYSPITGGDGNIEFLAHWISPPHDTNPEHHKLHPIGDSVVPGAMPAFTTLIDQVVQEAHLILHAKL
jgi:23S rRNA (cytidine1920-2'-O)/16S rRNA (cytidine1409-2'-O)-methyltransferase